MKSVEDFIAVCLVAAAVILRLIRAHRSPKEDVRPTPVIERRHRLVQLTILVIVIVPLFTLGYNVIRPQSVGSDPVSDAEIQSSPQLILRANSFDPSAGTMVASLYFAIPIQAKSRVWDTYAQSYIYACGGGANASCDLKPTYRKAKVYLEIDATKAFYFYDRSFHSTTSLTGVPESLTAQSPLATATVPILGEADTYPSDTYSTDFFVYAHLLGKRPYLYGQLNYIQVRWGSGSLSRLFDTSFTSDCPIPPASPATPPTPTPTPRSNGSALPPPCVGNLFHLKIYRPWPTKVYVYTLASVPIVVGVLFCAVVLRSHRRQPVRLSEFMVGVFTATLAILPLRLVLVPGNIPQLTRVDYMLGVGFALIVAAGLLRYALDGNEMDFQGDGPE